MKMTKLATSVLLGGAMLTASVGVSAAPFYLVVPDGTGNDGMTAVSAQLGIDFGATSVYTDDVDNSYDGSDVTTWVTVGDLVEDTGSGSVSSLIKPDGTGDSWTGINNTEGLGQDWNLSFEYTIFGEVVAVDPTGLPSALGIGALYDSGVIEITYNTLDADGSVVTSTRIMDLVVSASSGTIGNVNIFAAVDFSSAEIDATLADGFFFFADGNLDFYDLWLAGEPLPNIVITARIDTNVDPQYVPECDDDDCTTVSRSNTLNGSVQFDPVPVPGTLFLLGAGLLGLGWSRRSARRA